jgi:hypothetical protein
MAPVRVYLYRHSNLLVRMPEPHLSIFRASFNRLPTVCNFPKIKNLIDALSDMLVCQYVCGQAYLNCQELLV